MAKKLSDPAKQIEDFGARVVDELFRSYGDKFPPEDRELLVRVANRTAAIGIAELAGFDMKRERTQLRAQLSNLKSAGEIAAIDMVWRSFWTVVSSSLSFALAAL